MLTVSKSSDCGDDLAKEAAVVQPDFEVSSPLLTADFLLVFDLDDGDTRGLVRVIATIFEVDP